jgi:hypothetical protein
MNKLPKIPMIDNDVIKRHVVEKDANSLMDEIMKGKKIQPLRPEELVDFDSIKPEVIEAINVLIKERWDGFKSIVHIWNIRDKAGCSDNKEIDTDRIIIAYERQGWKVTYNGMSSFFTFTKK